MQPSASVAESSSAATGSAAHPPSTSQSNGQMVRLNPSRLDTLKKGKNPRVLKRVTIAQRVEKYGKYGLYDNNGKLYCKPCGKKMDEAREDSLTRHVTSGIHDVACARHIRAGAKFVLAPGYEEREERHKRQEKRAKECTDKKRKHEYIAQKWDKDRHLFSCGSLCLCMKKQFAHQVDHSKASDVVMGSMCAFVFFKQALFVHEKKFLVRLTTAG